MRVLKDHAAGHGTPSKPKKTFLALRDAVAALFTPDACRACDLPLVRMQSYPVCHECVFSLKPTEFAVCWTCGDAIGVDEEHAAGLVHPHSLRCGECTKEEPRFARAVAFGSYQGTLRRLIHLYKFDGIRSLAAPLGEYLALTIGGLIDDIREPLTVVAVPLFRGRRSYNQSRLLADIAVERLLTSRPQATLHVDHVLLRRTRRTESQSHLTPDQRRLNVRGAFAAGDVKGRHILLVDDVLTTGATVNECTAVLLRAGARSVWVATLARAHRRDTMPHTLSSPGGWTTWNFPEGQRTSAHLDEPQSAEMGATQ